MAPKQKVNIGKPSGSRKLVRSGRIWTILKPTLAPARPHDALKCTRAKPQRLSDQKVRIAPDCSGWCTEYMAAVKLFGKNKVKHVFASDSAASVRTPKQNQSDRAGAAVSCEVSWGNLGWQKVGPAPLHPMIDWGNLNHFGNLG